MYKPLIVHAAPNNEIGQEMVDIIFGSVVTVRADLLRTHPAKVKTEVRMRLLADVKAHIASRNFSDVIRAKEDDDVDR